MWLKSERGAGEWRLYGAEGAWCPRSGRVGQARVCLKPLPSAAGRCQVGTYRHRHRVQGQAQMSQGAIRVLRALRVLSPCRASPPPSVEAPVAHASALWPALRWASRESPCAHCTRYAELEDHSGCGRPASTILVLLDLTMWPSCSGEGLQIVGLRFHLGDIPCPSARYSDRDVVGEAGLCCWPSPPSASGTIPKSQAFYLRYWVR